MCFFYPVDQNYWDKPAMTVAGLNCRKDMHASLTLSPKVKLDAQQCLYRLKVTMLSWPWVLCSSEGNKSTCKCTSWKTRCTFSRLKLLGLKEFGFLTYGQKALRDTRIVQYRAEGSL